MNEFERKWRDLAKVDPKTYLNIFQENSDIVLMCVRDVYVYETRGINIYTRLLFHVISLNGELTKERYKEIKPYLSLAFGYEHDYENACSLASKSKKETREVRSFVDDVKVLLSKVPESVKTDIVSFCLILGSVDNRPTYKVRNFLSLLYE